jgi:hypothetical protein
MRLRCVPKTGTKNINAEVDVHFTGYFIDPSYLLTFYCPPSCPKIYNSITSQFFASNVPQSPTRFYSDETAYTYTIFNPNVYAVLTRGSTWVLPKEESCNFLLKLPMIFSISLDAEKFLSANKSFEKNVNQICSTVSKFVLKENLSAIGEISVFQEEGTEPKLFITYGIANKPYSAILKLWDEACKKVAETTSLETLKKVAVVFDQL